MICCVFCVPDDFMCFAVSPVFIVLSCVLLCLLCSWYFSCALLCLLCSWCFHVLCCVFCVLGLFMCFAVSPVFLVLSPDLLCLLCSWCFHVICCLLCSWCFHVLCCVFSCVLRLFMCFAVSPVFLVMSLDLLCLLCSWCFM